MPSSDDEKISPPSRENMIDFTLSVCPWNSATSASLVVSQSLMWPSADPGSALIAPFLQHILTRTTHNAPSPPPLLCTRHSPAARKQVPSTNTMRPASLSLLAAAVFSAIVPTAYARSAYRYKTRAQTAATSFSDDCAYLDFAVTVVIRAGIPPITVGHYSEFSHPQHKCVCMC